MDLGFRALGIRVQGLGFRDQGLGFRDQGLGFGDQGLGFRIRDSGLGSRVCIRSFCPASSGTMNIGILHAV